VYATVAGSYVLKIDADGKISRLAGSNECGYIDGQGASARFCIPGGIAVDNDGNVYVTDILNYKIRKITSNGTVSTLAGSTMGFKDGSGTNAQFGYVDDVALDAQGNIYIADGFRIRKISSVGQVSTIAGSKPGYLDGTTTNAQFTVITSMAIDTNGNLYLGDSGSASVLRRITTDGIVATVAGSTPGNVDGPGSNAKFDRLAGIAFYESGAIIIAEGADLGPMRKVEIN